MEYKIVNEISIYNLIVAGASKEMITAFERKACLGVVEDLSKSDDIEWFFRWTEYAGYIDWFIEKGFIEEDGGSVYRAGDRFGIVFLGPGVCDAPRLITDVFEEVMLTDTDGVAKIVSLKTGVVVDASFRYNLDGCITDVGLLQMVRAGYGDYAFYESEPRATGYEL